MFLTETRYTLPAEEEMFVLLEMEPTEDGIRLGLKSKILRDYWSKLADPKEPTKTSGKWGSVRFFNITDEARLPVVADADFRKIGEGLLLEGGLVNLAFTRLVDIDKGVEIRLKGVYPFSVRESFKLAFKDRMEKFYAEYIRDVRTSVMITSRQIGL